jgi:CDP-4-dehydro-6-deoxyglucose reductase, E3
MKHVHIGGQSVPWNAPDTLLEALEKADIPIAASCRAGSCHSCLVKSAPAQAPTEAQVGLKPSEIAQGFFLACQSRTPRDLSISLSANTLTAKARLIAKCNLSRNVVQLHFQVDTEFPFRPGQFIHLIRPDGLTRSYSIASLPEDGALELHVRVFDQGQMSTYLQHSAQIGEVFQVSGPQGHCFYLAGHSDQPLLLIGSSTGLSPLLGIARDALQQQHRGPIFLYHGSLIRDDWYLHTFLSEMSQANPSFQYRPVWTGESGDGDEPVLPSLRKGRLGPVVLQDIPHLNGFRAFVCGSLRMVRECKTLLTQAGLAADDFHSDAFISSSAGVAQSLLQRKNETPKNGL